MWGSSGCWRSTGPGLGATVVIGQTTPKDFTAMGTLHVTNRGAPVSLSYIIVVKYEITSHVRRMVFIIEIKEYFQLTVFFPQRCNVAKNIHRYISLLLGQTTKI